MDLAHRLNTEGDFMPSNKGTNSVLLIEGYEYRQRYVRQDGTIVWHCMACGKKAETLNLVIIVVQDHQHLPNHLAEEKRNCKRRLKEDAAISARGTTRTVTATALQGASVQLLSSINVETWSRHVCDVRKKHRREPAIPTDNSFELPDEYKVTSHNDEFLLADNGDSDNRIIIFCAEWARELLENSNHWGADGTFSVVPSTFVQLWTVHALVGSSFRPCVYALLPDKSQASYEFVLETIKDRLPFADPSYFTTDFEKAEINAIQKTFPEVSVKGCNFHFAQALWRRLQLDGHAKLYRSNPAFAFHCRFFLALAFVPADDVKDAFDKIKTSVQFEESMTNFIDYFGKNFIGVDGKNPRFEINLWNCHELLLERTSLTGNSYEAWHNALASQFGGNRVSIWELIKGLKNDEVLARQRTIAEETGTQVPSSSQAVVKKYDNMNNLLERYRQKRCTLINLIKGISNNLMY